MSADVLTVLRAEDIFCACNYWRHGDKGGSHVRCMISSLHTAAATRAALPVPLDVHGVLVCPDNGMAASVLQNVNVGLFTDTFQARSFD